MNMPALKIRLGEEIRSDSGKAVASTGIRILLATFAGVLIARKYGPDGRGLITLVLTSGAAAAAFLFFGLNFALSYFAPRHSDERHLYSVAMGFVVGLTPLAAATSLAIVYLTGGSSAGVLAGLIVGAGAMLALGAPALLNAAGKFGTVARLAILHGALLLGSVVLSRLLDLELEGALLAIVAGTSLTGLVGLALAAIQTPAEKPVFDRILALDLWRYGRKAHLGTFLTFMTLRMDIFIISALSTAEQVGLYAVAVGLAEMVSVPVGALGGIVVRNASLGRGAGLGKHRVFLLIGVPAVTLFVFGPAVLGLLYGPSFEPSGALLRILLPGTCCSAVWKVLADRASGSGQPRLRAESATVAFCSILVLDTLLIPSFLSVGAAIASSVSYALGLLFMVWRLRGAD